MRVGSVDAQPLQELGAGPFERFEVELFRVVPAMQIGEVREHLLLIELRAIVDDDFGNIVAGRTSLAALALGCLLLLASLLELSLLSGHSAHNGTSITRHPADAPAPRR